LSKNNPDIHIIKAEGLLGLLKNKHLLLDTSVFIDAFNHFEEFARFFNECKRGNVTIVTVSPVIAEFTKGVENTKKLSEKLSFVDSIIDIKLPISPDIINKYIPNLVSQYKAKGKSVSYVDFILAGLVDKYERDLVLLTKNPVDFPLSVFNLYSYFVIKMDRALQVYGIYQAKLKKQIKKKK